MENLRLLAFNDTRVSDLSPLTRLENLRLLTLYATEVTREQVQALRQVLPDCEIYFE